MSSGAKRNFAKAAQPEPNKKAQYPSPVTLRLKTEERDELEARKGDLTMSAYIRLCLFGGDVPKIRTRGKQPVKDYQALAQLLGMLGRSHVPNNLNQLTKAANSGTLNVSEDTELTIRQAAFEVAAMRLLLMKALGSREDET